jgi:hypothetical protein
MQLMVQTVIHGWFREPLGHQLNNSLPKGRIIISLHGEGINDDFEPPIQSLNES